MPSASTTEHNGHFHFADVDSRGNGATRHTSVFPEHTHAIKGFMVEGGGDDNHRHAGLMVGTNDNPEDRP